MVFKGRQRSAILSIESAGISVNDEGWKQKWAPSVAKFFGVSAFPKCCCDEGKFKSHFSLIDFIGHLEDHLQSLDWDWKESDWRGCGSEVMKMANAQIGINGTPAFRRAFHLFDAVVLLIEAAYFPESETLFFPEDCPAKETDDPIRELRRIVSVEKGYREALESEFARAKALLLSTDNSRLLEAIGYRSLPTNDEQPLDKVAYASGLLSDNAQKIFDFLVNRPWTNYRTIFENLECYNRKTYKNPDEAIRKAINRLDGDLLKMEPRYFEVDRGSGKRGVRIQPVAAPDK